LHHEYQKASDANRRAVRELSDKLIAHYTETHARCAKEIPFMTLDGEVDVSQLGAVRTGKMSHPNLGINLISYGSVMNFVSESRNQIRMAQDLPDKSDSPGLGHVACAATSVAQKAHQAVKMLREIAQVAHDYKFPSVHAFGTHVNNWWSVEVESASVDLVYFDKNGKYAPKNGGKFTVSDVETLLDGVGAGHVLFDDTLNVSGKFQENDTAKSSEKKKVESIVRAQYDGGFIKAYMCNVDDHSSGLGVLPAAIRDLSAAYNRVGLSNGGSLHSPEYFIVFWGLKKKVPKDLWLPHQLAPHEMGGKSYNPVRDPAPSEDVALAKRVNYLNTWVALKLYDMLRANMMLNIQVKLGVKNYVPIRSWISETPAAIYTGGWEAPNSRVDTNDLAPSSFAPSSLDLGDD